jgi:integrase
MAKKATWKECRDYTLRRHPAWVSGGGRKSAILYSGKFTAKPINHSESFDPTRITMRMMLDDCYELKAEGMKNASINRYISAVSKVLKFSQEMGLLSQDWTVPRFKRFKEAEDAQERNAYSAQDIKDMVTHARDNLMHDDLADIILFAALSGIRQGRILALKADDIDFENNMIRVTKPKTRGVKARYCGLHHALKDMLVRRCNEGRTNLFGDDWTTTSNEPRADKVRDAFKKCKRFIGKDGYAYTFHGLRHTYGTLMIQSGVNIKDVAHHMGHSSTQVTEKYLHAADKQLAAQVNSIEWSADLAIA